MADSPPRGMLLSIALGFCLSMCPCQTTSVQLTRPVAMWPLSNDTRGYNVLLNEEDHLEGGLFMDGPAGAHSALKLDGHSYVDAVIERKLSGPLDFSDGEWSIVTFWYIHTASSGVLYEYADKSNTSIFKVWLTGGQLNIEFSGLSKAATPSALPTNLWFQMSIVRDDEELLIETPTTLLLSEPNYFPLGDVLPTGVLRVGTGFRPEDPPFHGGVRCVRFYMDEVERSMLYPQSASHCDQSDSPDWTYEGPYGCMFYPCENGAQCTDNKSSGYHCDCQLGYTGRNCETDIDDCVGVACKNGGTCVDEVAGYYCRCRSDFRGEHCETVIEKSSDAGYFVLRARDNRPEDTSGIASFVVTSTRQCGSQCVAVPGCLSFSTSPTGSFVWNCVLYRDVLKPLKYSIFSNYYIPKM